MSEANDIITISKSELVKFDTTTEIIEQKAKEYSELTCQGPGGYDSVKAAWREMRDMRLDIEKMRVEKKDIIKQAASALDGEAKRLTKLTKPVEDTLHIKWKEVDDKAAKIKAEREAKEQDRKDAIQRLLEALRCNITEQDMLTVQRLKEELNDYSTISILESDYQEFHSKAVAIVEDNIYRLQLLIGKRVAYDEEQEELRIKQDEIRAERAEQEAESKRLADERDVFEAEQAKAIELAAAAQKKLDDATAKLEADKQKLIDDEKERKAAEQKAYDVKVLIAESERQAKENAEREKKQAVIDAAEKKLADERREQLRIENMSDTEFIEEYYGRLMEFGFPGTANKGAHFKISSAFNLYAQTLKEVVEELSDPVVVTDQ